MTTTEKGFLAYVLCTMSIVCGIVAMGIDNTHQLARCEATGQHREACRLLVLGR